MSGNFPAADTFGENKLGKLLAIREMMLSFMAIFLGLRLEVAPMARFYKPLPDSPLQKSQVVTLAQPWDAWVEPIFRILYALTLHQVQRQHACCSKPHP